MKNKKTVFFFFLLLITIGVLSFFYTRYSGVATNKPNNTSATSKISPQFKNLNIGVSSQQDLYSTLGNPEKTTSSSFGQVDSFSLKTSVNRKHEALISQGKVTFFKEVLTKDTQVLPEMILQVFNNQPTKLFGPDQESSIYLYVFPEDGFAYLANLDALDPVVFELWYFLPNNLSSLLQTFPFADYSLSPSLEKNF